MQDQYWPQHWQYSLAIPHGKQIHSQLPDPQQLMLKLLKSNLLLTALKQRFAGLTMITNINAVNIVAIKYVTIKAPNGFTSFGIDFIQILYNEFEAITIKIGHNMLKFKKSPKKKK